MAYKNGKNILPKDLLCEIQKYIQGEIIYIPKEESVRATWGSCNGTQQELNERNKEIYNKYLSGSTIDELTEIYCLSFESIRKILIKVRNNKNS